MSNPDRLQREAQEHAEVLIEDRGPVNALAWANHCMIRDTGGFWRRVHDEIVRQIRASNAEAELSPDVRAARANAVNGVWHCPTCGKANLIEERECFDCKSEEQDPAADRGDWQFHQEHDQ